MCVISINHHPSCKCTYYVLEKDCGASTSHPSCVQFMSFPVSRWSKKTSFINKVSGNCGVCSGLGDSSDVLARINLPLTAINEGNGKGKGKGVSSRASSYLGRPDTGLSMHTQASIDSVSSQMSMNSSFSMDGLSRSVTMGIKTINGENSAVRKGNVYGRRASWSMGLDPHDRFTRPEMAWRREADNRSNPEAIGTLSCSLL